MASNTFNARGELRVGGETYQIYRLAALADQFDITRLPYALKVLLECLLRTEDGVTVTAADISALASWDAHAEPSKEIAFMPARVLLQDFTGVPAVVDLAVMRDAMAQLGGDPARINPLVPVELVIDHSVQVDAFGTRAAFQRNAELEFERNQERYAFLRWGQQAFDNFKVVPPDTGIVHQVNLEYLSRVIFVEDGVAYPDTLVGTDSHTTMVNGLGVLGWGVGGIEAEAVMLGQPTSMLIPQVVGFKLTGELAAGSTATDLVLTITEMLRERGVVSKFVEFYGEGLDSLPLADRATIGNMSPEFGSTCAIFPIDFETLRYLELSGRSLEQIKLVEAYAREQGMYRDSATPDPIFTDSLELDLGTVVPSIAGPRRPQDRISLDNAQAGFRESVREHIGSDEVTHRASLDETVVAGRPPVYGGSERVVGKSDQLHSRSYPALPKVCVPVRLADGRHCELNHGDVVIAAITSCTNTSNPSVMVGAGLVAKAATERGLQVKPWVKTSLAPGSKVVTDYLAAAGLDKYLDELGFNLVGYGCTTCIGNSGPLPDAIAAAVESEDLAVASVLSGNRNFEGRINSLVKMNYLASPPLCVAYALAGTMDFDMYKDALGEDADGKLVYLRDLWPSEQAIDTIVQRSLQSSMFTSSYSQVFAGDERWNGLAVPSGNLYEWDSASTYVRRSTFFDGISPEPKVLVDIVGARVLVKVGDSVTTDHISPAGAIKVQSPAGQYLQEQGVKPKDFNSYGSRRGNYEVMVRGTFANIRLHNQLAPGTEGGVTVHLPGGEPMSIYDAAMRYRSESVPLVVLAGKEYGSGSSRDWAAKGPALLGIKVVIAESFERIHRSNLVGMGILPLQYEEGDTAKSLGLTGQEAFSITGLEGGHAKHVTVKADGKEFQAKVRIDTPKEVEYFRHGGILQFVLRRLATE